MGLIVDFNKRLKEFRTTNILQKERLIRYCAVAGVGIIIFALGVNVGDGRLSFWSSNPTGLPSSLDFSSVNQVYQALRQNYDGTLTTNQILDGIKEGIAQSTGDPYTEYFNAKQAKAFNDELNNSFSGVGAELGQDSSINR